AITARNRRNGRRAGRSRRGRDCIRPERGARVATRAQRKRRNHRSRHGGDRARYRKRHCSSRTGCRAAQQGGLTVSSTTDLAIIAGSIIVGILSLLAGIARMYRKVGPNQALIIYGVGGTRVVIGSGALVIPMFQEWRELSLELMSFDVAPQKELYTSQGVSVLIDAVTQIKVKSDLENVRTAAEQLLDKEAHARESAIRLVMEGHLRGIVGQLTVE